MRRSIKLWAVLMALVSLCLVFASCDSGSSDSDAPTPPTTVAVESINLNETELVLGIGTYGTLTATVLPEDATDKSVTWSSDKPEVATVDNNGKVTGVAEGTAIITVKTNDGGKTAICEVTVAGEVYTVTFDVQGKGETPEPKYAIDGKVTEPDPAPTAAGYTFGGWYKEAGCINEWNFSSDTVTADITLYAKWTQTVVSVTGVSLDKTELTITVGDQPVQLTATVVPDDATDKSVNWSSDDESVATVDVSGKVTAVAPGDATITVTTVDGSKTATCGVTVKAALPAGALAGEFSVSATQKVHFSQGNLVATIDGSGAPTAWKFAANQYDCLGEGGANKTIGSAAGDIDLFGWSTDGGTKSWGINTSTSNSDYSGDFKDWGKNAITNGGNTADTWRTLTNNEWSYLLDTRTVKGGTGAGYSYSLNITYGGKMGLVLYPDNYTGTVLSGAVDTLPDGVVFLPAAGYRGGSDVSLVGGDGYYWSATPSDVNNAVSLYFYSSNASMNYINRYNGRSVRLVWDEN